MALYFVRDSQQSEKRQTRIKLSIGCSVYSSLRFSKLAISRNEFPKISKAKFVSHLFPSPNSPSHVHTVTLTQSLLEMIWRLQETLVWFVPSQEAIDFFWVWRAGIKPEGMVFTLKEQVPSLFLLLYVFSFQTFFFPEWSYSLCFRCVRFSPSKI